MRSSTDVALHYAEYLPDGEPISDLVFVHGLASSGQQFEREAVHFAGQGFRVLVPDLRGHGLSGVPNGPIRLEDFSVATMAGEMIEILDHAQAYQVHWVGNSLGGILPLWLLGTQHKTRLISLALFGTCFSMRLPSYVSIVLRSAFLPGALVTAHLAALSTTKNLIGRKSIVEAIKRLNVGAAAAIAENVSAYDYRNNARDYHRSILVLRGGLDRAVNLRLRGDIESLKDCPHLKLVDLPEGGHCANFDMHEELCAALGDHWAEAEIA